MLITQDYRLCTCKGHICDLQKDDAQYQIGHRRSVFVSHRLRVSFGFVLIPLSVWTGYAGMVSPRVSQAGPDFTLCVVLLIMLPVFVVATVRFAEICRFPRPTWDRFPFNWRRDPLQSLFMASVCSLGTFFGSLLRLTVSGIAAIGAVGVYGSIFFGLILGQTLVYWMYRKHLDHF